MHKVELKLITKGLGELENQSAENCVVYIARVSNPDNQMNMLSAPKLIQYLIKHKHWSPFEHASATFEITTSRGIATQILRHRSFKFQEFSQRYAQSTKVIKYPARRQDKKNRQNSIDDMSQHDKDWWDLAQERVYSQAIQLYNEAIQMNIAKEQARFLLPLSTETKLYMTGDLRSWIHYVMVRTDPSTQLEHRLIAEDIKKILIEQCPNIAKGLEWI